MTMLAAAPRVGRLVAVAVTVVASVAVASPSTAAVIPDGAVMTYRECIKGAPIGADAHEQWSLRCRARNGGSAS